MFTPETAKVAGAIGGSKPKKRDFLTQQIIAELHEMTPGTDVKRARTLIQALITKAEAGDIPATKEVLDRVEGKVAQAITGDEDNPIHLVHRIERVIVDTPNPDSKGIPPAS